MNAGPGRIVLFFLMLTVALAASDYSYSLHLSKKSLFVKEPMIVTFDINQTDHSKVMFFDFSLKSGNDFFVHRLDKRVDEGYHARKERYTYLVYPLKAGKIELRFDLLVRRGNDDLLTTAFTGGRYNVKAVETDDSHEPIPAQKLEVKPLPAGTDLVGKFKVERRIKKRILHSYEPLYIDIEISGTGYAPDIEQIAWLPRVSGVRLFADKPKIVRRYTKEGIKTEALFRYALIAQKDYLIPGLHLQVFDTVQKKSYTIDEPAVKIEIEPAQTASLIDKKSLPPPIESPGTLLKQFFLSLLIFGAGWISAVLTMRIRRSRKRKSGGNEWQNMVKSSKDARTLLKLLVMKDPKRYEPWIERLEYALYKGEKADLKEIKKEVLHET